MTLVRIGLWGLLAERFLIFLWIGLSAFWALSPSEKDFGYGLLAYAGSLLAPWIAILCAGLFVVHKQWRPGVWALGIVATLWAIVELLPTLGGLLATPAVIRAGDTSFLFLSSGKLVSWACVVLVAVGCLTWLKKSYRAVQ